MSAEPFALHDVTDFPLVRLTGDTAVAGYAARWCGEMDRLIAGSQPFVLIYPSGERAETHEDRVTRGSWLKRNKAALAGKCLALIVIEPDPARRADLEAMFPALVKAFGTPQAARANAAEAEALALSLLGGAPARAGAGTD